MYAPPGGEAYWSGLESRIMARVSGGAAEWWSFFGGWTRVGLMAAGVTALIAGLVAYRSHTESQRLAYEAVIETPESVRAAVEPSMVPGVASRDATIRYVFSH
jgi:hypothetical protein